MLPSPTQRQLLRQLAQIRPSPSAHHQQHCLSRARAPLVARRTHITTRCFSACPRLCQEPHALPTASATPQPDDAHPAPPRRPRPLWVSAAIVFLLGAVSGTIVRTALSPPPPPVAGSSADEALKEKIRIQAEQLPLVKALQNEPGWTHHEAYSAFPASSKPTRITSGPLATAAGIGAYQHIFHPPPGSPEPIIDVLYLGLSTTGWPGVVHGGLLSTILDEHSARAALAETAGKGVLTAKLDVSFPRPTLAGAIYVAKARALREDELEEKERGKRDRKIWVDVWMETLEGVECVRGRALFVIPKGRQLRGLDKGF